MAEGSYVCGALYQWGSDKAARTILGLSLYKRSVSVTRIMGLGVSAEGTVILGAGAGIGLVSHADCRAT